MRDALVREVNVVGQVERRWEARQPESPPRGHQYSVPSGAGEAQASDCGWQSRALDHWRALECPSQNLAERHWDRIKSPRWATGCGNKQAVCSSRAWLAAWGAAADGEEADSEAVESGSPGRAVAGVAVGEVSATGGANVATSGNGISLRCC